MNEKELREAVRAELGGARSSQLVDQRMREAYESLGEMPRVKGRPVLRAMKWIGSAAGGLAAAFAILVGLSAANPALAASIPGMESIVGFFRGDIGSLVTQGGIEPYVQPVVSGKDDAQAEDGLQITETYFDGQVLLLGVQVTLPEAPEEYRKLYGKYDLKFMAEGKSLTPAYQTYKGDGVFCRVSKDVYVSTLTLYPANLDQADAVLDLPDEFELTVGFQKLEAWDTRLMVLQEGTDPAMCEYAPKTYELETPEPFTLPVEKTEGLQKTYPVNETKNGCKLHQITVTPAWTEVAFTLEEGVGDDDPIIMLLYDGQGEQLESLHGYGSYRHQRFRTLSKDETAVTVKFFHKSNAQEPIAEFTVPVEGGYYEEQETAEWSRYWEEGEVVYDPPVPETADNGLGENVNVELIKPDQTFTVYGGKADCSIVDSGSVDMTFSNLRYYDSWQEAGLSDEEMNLREDMKEHPENYAFVLLDLTFQCHDAAPHFVENGYWITGFADARLVPDGMDRDQFCEVTVSEEVQYFSEHGVGFTDYYHFQLEPNETKTVQVGYAASKENLKAGRLQLMAYSADLDNVLSETADGAVYGALYYLLDIPAPKEE